LCRHDWLCAKELDCFRQLTTHQRALDADSFSQLIVWTVSVREASFFKKKLKICSLPPRKAAWQLET
jgi:hypothetical protein